MTVIFELDAARGEAPTELDPLAAEPHPLARRAAARVLALLEGGVVDGIDLAPLRAHHGGKMFGVLVVEDRGRVGYLQAFSGNLGGRWLVDGFAPPLFDVAARDAFWPAGEATLRGMEAHIHAAPDDERPAMRRVRTELSRDLWRRLVDLVIVPTGHGDVGIRELFAPDPVPAGAGECAAPKLVGEALRRGLVPLALAEFWWGAEGTARRAGGFYTPCALRCGVILPRMLSVLRAGS